MNQRDSVNDKPPHTHHYLCSKEYGYDMEYKGETKSDRADHVRSDPIVLQRFL